MSERSDAFNVGQHKAFLIIHKLFTNSFHLKASVSYEAFITRMFLFKALGYPFIPELTNKPNHVCLFYIITELVADILQYLLYTYQVYLKLI